MDRSPTPARYKPEHIGRVQSRTEKLVRFIDRRKLLRDVWSMLVISWL